MAEMRKPVIHGGYPKSPINQGPTQGVIEPMEISYAQQSPLGQKLARNVGKGGPGVGADVWDSSRGQGPQMQHGEANPGVAVRGGPDILSQYGPERRR